MLNEGWGQADVPLWVAGHPQYRAPGSGGTAEGSPGRAEGSSEPAVDTMATAETPLDRDPITEELGGQGGPGTALLNYSPAGGEGVQGAAQGGTPVAELSQEQCTALGIVRTAYGAYFRAQRLREEVSGIPELY